MEETPPRPARMGEEMIADYKDVETKLAKIRIVSDGTTANTIITDEVSGKQIHRITKLTIDGNTSKGYLLAKLQIELLDINTVAYLEEIVIGGITYKPYVETNS